MIDDLNALGIILALGVTAWTLGRGEAGRRLEVGLAKRLLEGFAAFLLVWFLGMFFGGSMGHRGLPLAQWLVPGLCAGALYAFGSCAPRGRCGRGGRGYRVPFEGPSVTRGLKPPCTGFAVMALKGRRTGFAYPLGLQAHCGRRAAGGGFNPRRSTHRTAFGRLDIADGRLA